LGKLQILKLRADWKKQEGQNFTLMRFHDELLKRGMPPIRLLRGEMLRDKKLSRKALWPSRCITAPMAGPIPWAQAPPRAPRVSAETLAPAPEDPARASLCRASDCRHSASARSTRKNR